VPNREHLVDYDPYSYEIDDDPFPVYRWMRDEAPVYRNERLDFYALTRFADVMAGLLDTETYTSAQGITIEEIDNPLPLMITSDPPYHTRLRTLVNRAFTPRYVAALEDYIRAKTCSYLDAQVGSGGFDVVRDFTYPLPNDIFCELFGVPAEDRESLHDMIDAGMHREPGSAELPPSARDALAAMHVYWLDLVKAKRESPDDGFLSRLLAAEWSDDDGRIHHLDDMEAMGFCGLLVVAGAETSTKNIANAAVLLARHPDQRRAIIDEPDLVDGAVEEVLRYDGPSHYQGRKTTRDVELHDVTIPEGSRVIMVNGAANRDERAFDDPDRFDITRRIQRHLAFGWGVHLCLGAHLARMEAKVAIQELLARFPAYEVDESRLERAHSSNVRGYSSVPVSC
jgi:cytochrome P450